MARDEVSDPARASVCFGLPNAEDVALPGDCRFDDVLLQHYETQAARAQEQAIALKNLARESSNDDFWELMCAGLADIFDSQVSFVSTRVTHDRSTGRELPQLGEEGSYLNALGLYFNDTSKSVLGFDREVLYKGWDCPCSGMKHGKVFIIPSEAVKFTPKNPNAEFLPFELESYIGVPCFAKGVCVGHFGVIWNAEGATRRKLRWPSIESLLHQFEDLVQSRIMRHLGKDSLAHWRSLPTGVKQDESASAFTDFKSYAQVLSHELRTPMQGIVGPLDLIQTTIEQALQGKARLGSKDLLNLKEDIGSIQNSANRVIDTTEKIIEAYKLDMGRSHQPAHMESDPTMTTATMIQAGPRARRLSATTHSPRGKKRTFADSGMSGMMLDQESVLNGPTDLTASGLHDPQDSFGAQHRTPLSEQNVDDHVDKAVAQQQTLTNTSELLGTPSSSLVNCNIKSLVQKVVEESLKGSRRPDAIDQQESADGHIFYASYKQAAGDWHFKTVKWVVADRTPETLSVRESDLEKLVSCVFENAFKFTTNANIELRADVDDLGRFMVFVVSDTGPGIRPQFQPKLFQPFTQDDSSITRSAEGAGLGLLVARGLAEKLGGDVNLVRSETEGEEHGSEFHIRIPLTPPGLQTPDTQTSASPSVVDVGASTHRRGSSAGSYLLGTSLTPALSGYKPFGQLTTDSITPTTSTQISPQLANALEGFQTKHVGPMEGAELEGEVSASDDISQAEPLTFLVVEDNEITRKTLVKMLTKLGHDKSHIFEAIDGGDAIRQVTELHNRHAEEMRLYGTSQTPPIDLVLMDLWMPIVDGYEATKRILALYSSTNPSSAKNTMRRTVSEPGNVPLVNAGGVQQMMLGQARMTVPPTILALSADATDDASARAMQVGMSAFMPKPFTMKSLAKLVEDAQHSRAQLKKAKA